MIGAFCKRMNFPLKATEDIVNAYEKITKQPDCTALLLSAAKEFVEGESEDYRAALIELSQKLNISIYTVNLVLVIYSMENYTRQMYKEKGYNENLYNDTMLDTVYKLDECKRLYGVWGVFTMEWYRLFCKCRVFTLGRLQYEPIEAPTDYKDIVKKGDRIINCHIPGGGKLLDDDVTKSLQLAKKFFNVEPLILTCHSWLLYPPYEEMYGSNMRKFYERWDVVRLDESDEDFWRIFYKEKLEDLCEDDIKTSLQRKMLDFIKNGGKMGAGLAYMILY